MPAQEQDYIVRHIQTIAQLVARLRGKARPLPEKDRAEVEAALLLAVHLQEKNFGMPAGQFLALSAAGQFAALRRGESRATGHARCLTYVTLLSETAELYACRGSADLALGARQLALHLALQIALDQPAGPATVQSLVLRLTALLDGVPLHAPVQELLEQYRALTPIAPESAPS